MSSTIIGKGELFVMREDGSMSPVGKLTSVSVTMGEFTLTTPDTPEGIYERNCGPFGPMDPPMYDGCVGSVRTGWILDNFSKKNGHDHVQEACGIRWDLNDILRFLNNFTSWHKNEAGTWCLLFNGARSRGKGNKAWYGSFWCKGKTVRAHKFFAVAILGLRPRPNREDELDHHCFNTRCVSCVQVLTHAENQKRIRRRKDYGN